MLVVLSAIPSLSLLLIPRKLFKDYEKDRMISSLWSPEKKNGVISERPLMLRPAQGETLVCKDESAK